MVLGYHLVADYGKRTILLLVHDERHLQSQAGGQRGACERDIRAGGPLAGERLLARGLGGTTAGAALRQRQRDEGLNDVGGNAEPGCDALVQQARVSNDNAHAETVFRTAKYLPAVAAEALRHAGGCQGLGTVRAVVQRGAQSQRDQVCDSRTAASW